MIHPSDRQQRRLINGKKKQKREKDRSNKVWRKIKTQTQDEEAANELANYRNGHPD